MLKFHSYHEVCSVSGFSTLTLLSSQGAQNPFVEAALCYGFTYLGFETPLEALNVTILADDSYYSQEHTSTACPQNAESQFVHFHVPLSEAHKTGLGSSAALVTALIGALLHFYKTSNKHSLKDVDRWKQVAHNLAQAAHCSAQGKIGSGFDVAAAVWGSCLYRRFSPSILEEIGEVNSAGFADRLHRVICDIDEEGKSRKPGRWDMEVLSTECALPRRLRLVMCDVDQGSSTPGMVKKVLAWRKAQPAASTALWKKLEEGTDKLAWELQEMTRDHKRNPQVLGEIIQKIREGVREMSEQAGVPIEPGEQTVLLDGLTKLPFVVGGVVPGAGGYDALALLVEDSDSAIADLQTFLHGFVQGQHGAQASERRVRLLRARQDMEGMRAEAFGIYKGWS